jgi:hypothetical protein
MIQARFAKTVINELQGTFSSIRRAIMPNSVLSALSLYTQHMKLGNGG